MGCAFAHVSGEDMRCEFYCFLAPKIVVVKSSMEPSLPSGITSGCSSVAVTELHACQDLNVCVPKLNSHPYSINRGFLGGDLGMRLYPCWRELVTL